jgi:hypothetical protein
VRSFDKGAEGQDDSLASVCGGTEQQSFRQWWILRFGMVITPSGPFKALD